MKKVDKLEIEDEAIAESILAHEERLDKIESDMERDRLDYVVWHKDLEKARTSHIHEVDERLDKIESDIDFLKVQIKNMLICYGKDSVLDKEQQREFVSKFMKSIIDGMKVEK